MAFTRSKLSLIIWRLRLVALALRLRPIAGGAEGDGGGDGGDGGTGGGDGGDGGDGKGEGDGAGAGGDGGDGKGEGDGEGKRLETADDWKKKARAEEREAKKARKEAAAAKKRAEELEEEHKDERDKELDRVRKEAADKARSEMSPELRKARREAAIARKGAGRFASIDQAIKLVELDDDELFDEDGKIDDEVLVKALDDLLEANKNLAATAPTGGDAGGGKGAGASKDLEEMSVEDHLAEIQGADK